MKKQTTTSANFFKKSLVAETTQISKKIEQQNIRKVSQSSAVENSKSRKISSRKNATSSQSIDYKLSSLEVDIEQLKQQKQALMVRIKDGLKNFEQFKERYQQQLDKLKESQKTILEVNIENSVNELTMNNLDINNTCLTNLMTKFSLQTSDERVARLKNLEDKIIQSENEIDDITISNKSPLTLASKSSGRQKLKSISLGKISEDESNEPSTKNVENVAIEVIKDKSADDSVVVSDNLKTRQSLISKNSRACDSPDSVGEGFMQIQYLERVKAKLVGRVAKMSELLKEIELNNRSIASCVENRDRKLNDLSEKIDDISKFKNTLSSKVEHIKKLWNSLISDFFKLSPGKRTQEEQLYFMRLKMLKCNKQIKQDKEKWNINKKDIALLKRQIEELNENLLIFISENFNESKIKNLLITVVGSSQNYIGNVIEISQECAVKITQSEVRNRFYLAVELRRLQRQLTNLCISLQGSEERDDLTQKPIIKSMVDSISKVKDYCHIENKTDQSVNIVCNSPQTFNTQDWLKAVKSNIDSSNCNGNLPSHSL